MERKNKIVFLKTTEKPFTLELIAVSTMCFTQYLSYINPKGEDSSCKIIYDAIIQLELKDFHRALIWGEALCNYVINVNVRRNS